MSQLNKKYRAHCSSIQFFRGYIYNNKMDIIRDVELSKRSISIATYKEWKHNRKWQNDVKKTPNSIIKLGWGADCHILATLTFHVSDVVSQASTKYYPKCRKTCCSAGCSYLGHLVQRETASSCESVKHLAKMFWAIQCLSCTS